MKLLIVRHGQSIANFEDIIAGQRIDSPLTKKGANDAKLTAKRLAGTHIDAIISSPLQRAVSTAEILRDALAPGMDIEIMDDFIEIDMGDATGWPHARYIAKVKAGELVPGVESNEALFHRVARGIDRLRHRQGTVLLATHNDVSRMIICCLENIPADKYFSLPDFQNGEVKTFDIR